MSVPVNSFDVFDTLIARRSVEPRRVLHEHEARAGIPGLAAARTDADRRLGGLGRPYDLGAIWREVAQLMNLDVLTAGRLRELEVSIEHEECIPIAENLALVRDGDVLVSDTYLPPDVVMSLLRKAGLRHQVALVVSNDGKFQGSIWPELLRRVPIREHLGDNPHSDGRTPSAAGIKAVIYTGAARTPVERLLAERGFEPLANVVREARLANPFPPSRPQERHLWLLTCQLNFPLLYFASLLLERHAAEADAVEQLFVSRDCLLWRELHRRLFPARRSTYFFASRKCLLKPSPGYLDYIRSAWRPDAIVVDLFSTGASWSRLAARLKSRIRCFFIGLVDDYAYLPDAPKLGEWLDVSCVFKNSELGAPVNKNVEMLNYAPHPSVEDVRPLPGGGVLPVLADALEYDAAPPQAAHDSFAACLGAMDRHPGLPKCADWALPGLIKDFVRLICADAKVPQIYAGHAAADAAYLRRILG